MNETEKIWIEHHSKLRSFIRNNVNDKVEAEDILQDVFVRVYLKINTLKNKNKLESWLYRITKNVIIDFYRSHQMTDELPKFLTQAPLDKAEINMRELSSCLPPMINQLPEKYRHAIQLSDIEGMTQKALAIEKNMTLSGSKSRVQRGRVLLNTMLHDCCNLEFSSMKKVISYETKEKGCKYC